MMTQYRHIMIEDFDGSPTQCEIAAIQFAFGKKLPDSFLDFLAVANGGYLDYIFVKEAGVTDKIRPICSIFTTRSDGRQSQFSDHFLFELEYAQQTYQLEKFILPFARDHEDNRFCLDLTKPDRERVIFCRQSFDYGMVVEVLANQFSSFLKQLQPDEELFLEKLEYAEAMGDEEMLARLQQNLNRILPHWKLLRAFQPYVS
ncbi:SMI1/KNR4 family protein [Algicola sagamiensis]|uniref:SMI1/KNR4 family protein n=1 Tax=Algicola sagamiensis TaxID=163869 RepID=UPI0003718AE5|nr:SMI1/KNR4 family protein [Algicola sagamiensis]